MAKTKGKVEKLKTVPPVDEDIRLHEKGWMVQKVGWVLLSFFVLLAALGAFGTGILSHKKNGPVEYEQFLRFESETRLIIRSPSAGELTISLPADYLEKFDVQSLFPQPDKQWASGKNMMYTFITPAEGMVRVYLYPKTRGPVKTNINVNGNGYLLSHYIYP